MWRLALVEGIPVTWSAVKISYSHPEDVNCAGKTVILKKLRKHLRAKHQHCVGGDYYNKIPSAEDKVRPPSSATANEDGVTSSSISKANDEESQAVPLLPRMTFTDYECEQLKRACGEFVTRKTRVYPNVFHW